MKRFVHPTLFLMALAACWPAARPAHAQTSPVPAQNVTMAGEPFRPIDELARYVADHPNDYQARRQYADALYEDSRFPEAANQYEVYLQGMQGSPESVHRYLIALASYAGDNARGERVAERYLAFFPTDSDLHMRLGYFRLWQGKYDTAVDAFEQALRLNPANAEARQGLQATREGRTVVQRLSTPPPVRAVNPADQPLLDERRYRFIEELLAYRRFADAYDQLMLLSERHTETQRWLAMYETIDKGLVSSVGFTPAYPVDRYTYLLQQHPSDRTLRYNLVDALADAGRIAEAYDVLLDQDYVTPEDSGYVSRLAMLESERATLASGYMAKLEARFSNESNDRDVLRELIDAFIAQRRSDEALTLYERMIASYPDDASARYEYANLLTQNGLFPEAGEQVEMLLARDSTELAYRMLYARLEIASGRITARSGRYLDEHLARYPDDADALLDRAERELTLGRLDAADRNLRRAFAVGTPSDRNRMYAIDARIERALQRRNLDREAQALSEARMLAGLGNTQAAIDDYERYFQVAGRRPRAVLVEMAEVYAQAEQYGKAIGILESLQELEYEYALAWMIARYRYYLEDRAGAIRELEDMIARNPRDVAARDLLAQIYLESRRFAQADTVYHHRVDRLGLFSRLEPVAEERLNQRIQLVEHMFDTDYAGLFVPVSQYITARGRITEYEHWAQGMLTQVTVPRDTARSAQNPFVLTAGLISHFQNGTRRLLPNSGTAVERVNQIMAGGIFDMTNPRRPKARRECPAPRVDLENAQGYIAQVDTSETVSRMAVSLGLFDYAGGRTTGFAEINYQNKRRWIGDDCYWHEKHSYALSARSTEGATVLWSPAGGQFGLRLTQFEAKGKQRFLKNDRLTVMAGLALNVVRGRADSTTTGISSNVGTDLRLESSYRFQRFLSLGLSLNNINYRHVLETYFSPQDYRSYDIWLEFEGEYKRRWYVRARATTGLVSYRRDAFAARIESDVIYQIVERVSVSVSGSTGYSVRFLEGSGLLRDDRYRMGVLAASLYWTL
ncbi:MAG: tetratricopeptide repeat protein [Rhodothermales bacterium]